MYIYIYIYIYIYTTNPHPLLLRLPLSLIRVTHFRSTPSGGEWECGLKPSDIVSTQGSTGILGETNQEAQ